MKAKLKKRLKGELEIVVKLVILMSMTTAIIWGLRPVIVPIMVETPPTTMGTVTLALIGISLWVGIVAFAIKFIYWEPSWKKIKHRFRCLE